ncbi:class I SAM-dependent methyltransferase [Candidatus Bipolaricaulota bacterium]
MTCQPASLFDSLTEIHRRPEPFETYTAKVLWDDEHISKNMLALHLDEEAELASRPYEFIRRSADWIKERFALAEGRSVVDFGCGPGLYTTRFAAAGADVTGIDFSRRSIAHAESEAERQGLAINYILGDYLEFHPERVFDLITMLYCDLCALSPDQRRRLLSVFRDLLTDHGSVLLDVYTLQAYAGRQESTSHGSRLMDGFWTPGDYWGFKTTFKYDENSVVLDKYTIIEPHQTWCVYNWLQYFSPATLAAEFEQCGLRIVEQYADVAGTAYADGDLLAVVAQKIS